MSTPQSVPPSAPLVCGHCGTPLQTEPARITIRRVLVQMGTGGASRADDRQRTGTYRCHTCAGSTRIPLVAALTAAS